MVVRRITIDSTCQSVAVTPFALVGRKSGSQGKSRAGTQRRPYLPVRPPLATALQVNRALYGLKNMEKSMKFSVRGGRGGEIDFDIGGTKGILDWELIAGESAMVVYTQGSKWTSPENRAMSKQEVRDVVQLLANKRRWQMEVQSEDGTEVIKPK